MDAFKIATQQRAASIPHAAVLFSQSGDAPISMHASRLALNKNDRGFGGAAAAPSPQLTVQTAHRSASGFDGLNALPSAGSSAGMRRRRQRPVSQARGRLLWEKAQARGPLSLASHRAGFFP